MKYPVEHALDWERLNKPTFAENTFQRLREPLFRMRAKRLQIGVDLHVVRREAMPLAPDEVLLICVLRNASKYIPSFLAHYRSMGLRRFAFVDDQSDDETRTLLLQEDGVDIFESNVRYGAAARGLIWRDMLVDLYGRNRWYVSVDVDEYLVFPDFENRPLIAFIADLRKHSLRRSLAVMLDIYPETPLGAAPTHNPLESFPTVVCPLYDMSGYSIAKHYKCTTVRGGPRARLFDSHLRLTKFPVIYMDRPSLFTGVGAHSPLPLRRNHSAVHAVLLHYKFTTEALAEFHRLLAYDQHPRRSEHYRKITQNDGFNEALTLRYAYSARFEGSRQLVDSGFMQAL
jgi:hypothetical protein